MELALSPGFAGWSFIKVAAVPRNFATRLMLHRPVASSPLADHALSQRCFLLAGDPRGDRNCRASVVNQLHLAVQLLDKVGVLEVLECRHAFRTYKFCFIIDRFVSSLRFA